MIKRRLGQKPSAETVGALDLCQLFHLSRLYHLSLLYQFRGEYYLKRVESVVPPGEVQKIVGKEN